MNPNETIFQSHHTPIAVAAGLSDEVASPALPPIRVVVVDTSQYGHSTVLPVLEKTSSPRLAITYQDRSAPTVLGMPNQDFDAILLDLTSAQETKLHTCRQLRQKAGDTPIIALLNDDDEALATELLESGAQDYLLKSEMTPALLTRTIQYTFERARTEKIKEYHQQQLLEASRQAGIAEMATGILHNVGNVLNSVGVCVSCIQDQMKNSSIDRLRQATDIVRQHEDDLATFVTQDERGKMLPAVLDSLAQRLQKEHDDILEGMKELRCQVDHLKTIVSAQQSLAKPSGIEVQVNLQQILDELLTSHAGLSHENRIQVVKEFSDVQPIWTDKHKVIQIVGNLVLNAIDAIVEQNPERRVLTVRLRQPDDQNVEIQVSDTGIGIAPENTSRIFQHGFTTKDNGHGFGLHSSANAATELGGKLYATSPGVGQGATFTLALPTRHKKLA